MSRYTIEYSRQRGPQGATGATGATGPGAFDLVPGDGIIIDSVPGTGVDPFSSLLVAGTGISTSYNSGTRVWTITNTGGGGGGGGSTNLSVSTTTTTVVVASDTGTDATIAAASGSAAGVMTAAMFTKLDGIASGATANSADATLLARANHTGTQTWSTITSTPTTLSGYGITDAITSAAVAAGYQPLDSDLTAIAALTTTSFGRSLLTQADAAATRTTIGAGTSSFDGAYSSLSGVPSTFAPASHSTDLLTSGTLPVARGGTGTTDASTGTGGIVLATSPTLVTPNIGAALYASARTTEITSTPTGTTQTITLGDGNHQTLSLASTSGDPTITLTVPTSSAAGTLILIQHGTTPRSITWAVSSGSILWMGGQPTWASDAVSTSRVISWRWNGSVMRLAATEVGS